MKSLFLLFFGLSFSTNGMAQQNLEEKLAPYIANGTFSGTVSYVCRATEPIVNLSFGFCNREAQELCATDTKFRISSMSKSFTAAAVLKLAESGTLSIDDEVSRWLPEYPRDNLIYNGQAVLIRHLLSHTSGIPDWEDTTLAHERLWISTVSLDEIMTSVRDFPLLKRPGSEYTYSNTGYNLAALIVERASGLSLEEFLQSYIFNNAQLTETGITLEGQLGLAKGYAKDLEGDTWFSLYDFDKFRDRDLTLATGSGSLYSTSRDVIRWLQNFAGGRVVSPASVALAFTPNLGHYGLGWSEIYIGHTKLHWHNGALSPLGFSSDMGIDDVSGFAYSILTNVNLDQVSQEALRIIEDHLAEECRL